MVLDVQQSSSTSQLSIRMRSCETLRAYTNWYWELYSEIGRGNKQVIASTFRMGLLEESVLRDLLTMRPLEDMHQLMRRIKGYKRLEDDRLQGKGKALARSQYHKDFRLKKLQQRNWRESRTSKEGSKQSTEGVNAVFKESLYKILERIKDKPYFRWPRKMGGDLAQRNQTLYCTYHREKRYTTKQCRVLKDHLEELVKAGHLKGFLVRLERGSRGQGSRGRNLQTLPPPLGIVEVIHAMPRGVNFGSQKGILSIASPSKGEASDRPNKRPRMTTIPITFGKTNLEGTSQPHNDALVITCQVGGFW